MDFAALLETVHIMRSIYNSDSLDWSSKFDRIFNKHVSKKLYQMLDLDYYDPDTSHEEDVKAFVQAVEERLQHLSVVDYTDKVERIVKTELVFEDGARYTLSPVSYTQFSTQFYWVGTSDIEYKKFLSINKYHLLSTFRLDDDNYWIEVNSTRFG